jgi:glutamate-ammonia-ligase adenylyltransferase
MALTRARVVAATSPEIADRATTVISEALSRPRDPDRLVVDVADMRLRIAKQHKGESRWDVKHHRGGLVDIEFIAQYLQLLHGPANSRVLTENTAGALGRMGEVSVLESEKAACLTQALGLWWKLQDSLRLIAPDGLDDANIPASVKAALARAAARPDFETLEATMEEAYARVRELYDSIVDAPAAEARKRLPASEES